MLPAPHVVANPLGVTNDVARDAQARQRAWIVAMASTSAALATSFALTEGYAARATRASVRDLERSRNLELDLEGRNAARRQSLAGEQRAELLQRVSDVCLAGSVAATGAALLIWLTGKQKGAEQPSSRTLLGPMVLRGVNGGGLVLREKF